MSRDGEIPNKSSLWAGLDQKVGTDAAEEWQKVIRRRLTELDSGAVTAIPWSEARLKLLTKLPK